MAIGVSCSDSSRLWAVTVISSMAVTNSCPTAEAGIPLPKKDPAVNMQIDFLEIFI